jgi:apolipoprotein N-acyltransferase
VALIVWPETSFPASWVEIAPHVPLQAIPKWRNRAAEAREFMRRYARGELGPLDPRSRERIPLPPATILLGLNSEVVTGGNGQVNKYNSALLLHENGALGERYHKIHRLPFGEYVPLRDWLPWMNAFAPYESDYSLTPGEHLTRFTLNEYAAPEEATKETRGFQIGPDGRPIPTYRPRTFRTGPDGNLIASYRFGVLVCYEDTDPILARPYGVAGADGPPVDFLVNISNDGWFDGSSEHDEHLAVARFRAVEARRSVARAVNMGISAVIDGNGRVLKPSQVFQAEPNKGVAARALWVRNAGDPVESLPMSEWQRYKKVWGLFIADVPIDNRTSLYSLWGDWLAGVCWGVVAVGLVWAAVTRRRRPVLASGGAA